MSEAVSQSQFYMWRTLFSIVHADNVVTDEEIQFMAHVLEGIDFSEEQTRILKEDIITPQNVEAMFEGITDPDDRLKFFDFARDLVWVDGDFGSEEQSVMLKLFKTHLDETNIDDLVGNVSLELEEDPSTTQQASNTNDTEFDGPQGMMKAFRKRFLGLLQSK